MVRFTLTMAVGCLLIAGLCSVPSAQARPPRPTANAAEKAQLQAAIKALPAQEKAAINGLKRQYAEKVKVNNLAEAEKIAVSKKTLTGAALNASIAEIKALHKKNAIELKKGEEIEMKKIKEAFKKMKKDLEAALKKLK
jgi:hypothetical protein